MKRKNVIASIIIAAIAVTGITAFSISNRPNREIESMKEDELNTNKSYNNNKDSTIINSKATDKNIDVNNYNNDKKSKLDKNDAYLDKGLNEDTQNNDSKKTIDSSSDYDNVKNNVNDNNSVSSVVDKINNLNEDNDNSNSAEVFSPMYRIKRSNEIINFINKNKPDNREKISNKDKENTKEIKEKDINSKVKETNNTQTKNKKNSTYKDKSDAVNNTNKEDSTDETIKKVQNVIQNTKGKPVNEKPSFINTQPSKTDQKDNTSINKNTTSKDDIEKPEITHKTNLFVIYPTLKADNIVSLPYGSHWKISDSNVKAYDTVDGEIQARVTYNDINENVPGTYQVTLKATNSRGKTTTKKILVNILPKDKDVENKDETKVQGQRDGANNQGLAKANNSNNNTDNSIDL